jgi:hypothetical protein
MGSFTMGGLDGKGASALGTKRHVTINSNWLTEHFEIACRAYDFSAVRSLIA